MGSLAGGIAVVLETDDSAYWVKDGTVYTVDEAARKLLPKNPQAPAGITDERVRRVAK